MSDYTITRPPRRLPLGDRTTENRERVEDTRTRIGWIFEPMEPKSFVVATCSIAVIALLGIATLNWSVNPYGQYPPRLIEPLVQDSRVEKLALFDGLEEQPDGLVLGSSRAMKFEPQYLQKKTHLTFFNFAVNHGRPEDFVAILRNYRDRYGRSPKLVLIGVDIASLNDVVPSDARLSSAPRLHRFVQGDLPWSEEFERYCQLFSYQQSSASMKSLRLACSTSPRKQIPEQFDSDGTIQYLERDEQLKSGTYDFDGALQYNQRELQSIFSSMKHLSKTRLGYLLEAVRLCEFNGCQAVLFATVHHPFLRETLAEKTDFLRRESEAAESLQMLARSLGADFLNFGTVESFGGEPTEFYDGVHPMEANTRRMIDHMAPIIKEALYAVQ
jgi:hypothetical protein